MVNTNCIFLVKTDHFYKEMWILEFVTMLGMKRFWEGKWCPGETICTLWMCSCVYQCLAFQYTGLMNFRRGAEKGDRRGRTILGANLNHFLYKVLGNRSMQNNSFESHI